VLVLNCCVTATKLTWCFSKTLSMRVKSKSDRLSIGLRNSHDKSMRLALTCGYRVFVCSNMAFSGDFTPVTMSP
jgi:hypothetical protein